MIQGWFFIKTFLRVIDITRRKQYRAGFNICRIALNFVLFSHSLRLLWR